MNHVARLLGMFWKYLREVSGENDYARYCRRIRQQGIEPISPQAFYLEQLERKNSRPARCC